MSNDQDEKRRPGGAGPVGASWWREALAAARSPLVRKVTSGFALFGGATALTGCFDLFDVREDPAVTQRNEEMEQEVLALDLQQKEGWNVGQTESPLVVPSATPRDVDGGQRWREVMESLPWALAPSQPQLAPYYVPTLFQSLAGPPNESLRSAISPVYSTAMETSFARGQSLLSLFQQAGFPADTAVIVDVPGSESVAVAAGLASHFEPVFGFDNWPHPLGVVPAHETLGASLYYLPLFERTKAIRPPIAAPVFVLDAYRLLPYVDQDSQFDNRYVAKLPTAENLLSLGLHHVLYVHADASQTVEMDDLNQDFIAYRDAGIDIKMIALTDFQASTEPPPTTEVAVGGDGWPLYTGGFYYYFGGSPIYHWCFWNYYGWHAPVRAPVRIAAPPPTRISQGFVYRAAPRPTLFAGSAARPPGVAHWAPAGLGRVAVRTSRVNGSLTGIRAGRSGSFGRFHGSFSA